jgi:uncharacterized protein YcfL
MFVAATLAIAFAGCGGTVNTVERAQPIGQPHVVNDKRIITNSSLNDYVSIVGVNQAVDAGGLMKVQVDVTDTHSGPAAFYYKFEWYDDQEMVVDSPMSVWTEETMQSGEQISLTGIAPNPRAKDFRLKLEPSPN